MRLDRDREPQVVLVEFLSGVRRRYAAATFASAWIATVSGVLATAALLLATNRQGREVARSFLHSGPAVLLVVVAVSLAALIWTHLRKPSLLALARIVDSSLGLGLMVVTAAERSQDPAPGSLPERALFEEVGERLEAASPSQVVPAVVQRWFVALPLACGLVALAVSVPLGPPSATTVTEGLPTVSAESVSDSLERLALFLEDGERSDDDQLAGFAPLLRELREYLATSAALDEGVAERLSQLLDSMAQQAAASDSVTAGLLAAAFEGTMFDTSSAKHDDRPFQFGTEGSQTSDATVGDAAVSMTPEFDPASVFRTLGEVASSVERALADAEGGSDLQRAGRAAPDSETRSSGYYTDWDDEMADAQAAKRAAIRQRGRAEAVAGAANQADDASGDAAGGGTQPLDSGQVEQSAGMLQLSTQEFIVQAELRDDGNTNSYLPEPELGARSVETMDSRLSDSLIPGNEMPVVLEAVVVGNRDLVAGYFGRKSNGRPQTSAP